MTTAGRPRILFVDDSPLVLDGIRRILDGSDRPWDIEFVGSAARALAIVAERDVDVVATDLRMPEVSGDALVRRVRRLRPGTRFVLLCGDSSDPRALAVAGEDCTVIEKPCGRTDILSAIETALRARSRATDAKESEA